jgi:hypothetical protein
VGSSRDLQSANFLVQWHCEFTIKCRRLFRDNSRSFLCQSGIMLTRMADGIVGCLPSGSTSVKADEHFHIHHLVRRLFRDGSYCRFWTVWCSIRPFNRSASCRAFGDHSVGNWGNHFVFHYIQCWRTLWLFWGDLRAWSLSSRKSKFLAFSDVRRILCLTNSQYSISNLLPTQYFLNRLGLANGIVKFGGGVGAAVLAIAIDALVNRVGVAWTFRVLGILALLTGAPAAWFIRERAPPGKVPFLDLSLFHNLAFTAIFLAGASGTFALFIPPYFLPLVADSIGFSSSTGAGLVGAFNGCTAIGRLLSGWLSDRFGPVNIFLSAMVLNALSMLAIWPVSKTLTPLVIFALFNGLANGAFFTLYPVVVASTVSRLEHQASAPKVAVAMSMAISGWTPGYLLGA